MTSDSRHTRVPGPYKCPNINFIVTAITLLLIVPTDTVKLKQ